MTYEEILKDFSETLRRNPHYKGAGGFKKSTLLAIERLLTDKANLEDKNNKTF